MNIRKYADADLDVVKEITAICFDGVSIDQNIEKEFGPIAGYGWRWRKKRHIDADVDAHADGMFVAEVDGEVVGYITTRVDEEAKIGGIPNYAVLPQHQRKGIGLKLVETAIEHLKGEGMAYIRIETLDQNEVGRQLYPRLGFKEVARQIHYIMPVDGLTRPSPP